MLRHRKPSRRLLGIMAASLAVLLVAETAALAITLTRNGGPVTAVRTKTDETAVQMMSTTMADVPGMSTTVNVPSGEQALLLITFSANSMCHDSSTPDTAYCIVRVLVDGAPASPGEVTFDSASDGSTAYAWETNSMQFVAGPLAAGSHSVRVQWRHDEADGWFYMKGRTLTVLRSRVG